MHVVYFFQNKKGHVFAGGYEVMEGMEGMEENPGKQGHMCVRRGVLAFCLLGAVPPG